MRPLVRFRLGLLCLVLAVIVPAAAFAQGITATGPDILVRNATLIDPTGNTEDRTVNLLIRNGKLDLITEDKISRDEADRAIDAGSGFVLGKLVVGEAPNFMILREDPRENFEVLLDTRAYADFAVYDGVVVRNRLGDVRQDVVEDEPKKTGWLA